MNLRMIIFILYMSLCKSMFCSSLEVKSPKAYVNESVDSIELNTSFNIFDAEHPFNSVKTVVVPINARKMVVGARPKSKSHICACLYLRKK